MSMKSNFIIIKCPCCNKQRLFDLEVNSKGTIKIKCQKCHSIIRINLELKKAKLDTSVENRSMSIKCPLCNRHRLFDISKDVFGKVEIKCQKCAQIVEIDLEKVHTVLSK